MKLRLVTGFVWLCLACMVSSIAAADEAVRQDCLDDTMIVFDASGSMGTTDFTAKKPHIERVKEAFRAVVPEIPADRRMGLIVYGQGAYNKCDSIELKLKPEPNAGPAIMSEIETIVPAGRTPLTESVRQAAEVLNYRENTGVVVLLTDGEETCGGKACEVARQLKQSGKNITIHVIGYRNKEAGGLSDTFGARCMADETGGLYLRVETVDQLAEALRKTITCPMFSQDRSAPQPVLAAVPHPNRRH